MPRPQATIIRTMCGSVPDSTQLVGDGLTCQRKKYLGPTAIGTLEPPPHHPASRRVLVGLGKGRRRHNAAVLAIKPRAPLRVLQRTKIRAPVVDEPGLREAPQHVLTTCSPFSMTTTGA